MKYPLRAHGSKTMQRILALAVAAFSVGLVGCSDSIEKTSVTGVEGKFTAVIDFIQCNPCPERFCVKTCPKQAIDSIPAVKNNVPIMTFIIDTDKCIKCGYCFEICPWGAVYWKR
jgi:Fe-S-cluster-containing hydrogenase component 2